MIKIFDFWRDKFTLPTIILIVACIVGLIHLFSYLIPFTDDAFVVTNSQPVAADVSGYITHIYVKNGQYVKKGTPLFKVFDVPYKLALRKAQSLYKEVLAEIEVLNQEIQKNQDLLNMTSANLKKVQYEYSLKKLARRSVSHLEIKELSYDIQSLTSKVDSLKKEIIVNTKQVIKQKQKAKTLKVEIENAKVNLDLTNVRAGANGVIDNFYLAVGTAIIQHQPLFSLINTDEWYVQANFYETDLRYVKPGDEVIIVLRMYYFTKVFHGRIVNRIWVANRQLVDPRTQQQNILDDNEWLNIPQRMPLQIKILDPDPRYPLHSGTSAYVYIKTHSW